MCGLQKTKHFEQQKQSHEPPKNHLLFFDFLRFLILDELVIIT